MPINHGESLSPLLALPSGINMVCHIQRILYTVGIIRTYCQLQFSIIYFSLPNKINLTTQFSHGQKENQPFNGSRCKVALRSRRWKETLLILMNNCPLCLLMLYRKASLKSFHYYIFCIMPVLKINVLFASENTAADFEVRLKEN